MATFTATPKQVELINAITSGEYLYVAMGGGIRGTKTFGTLGAFILLCKLFPGSRWAVVRKDLPTLRRNTIPSFYKLNAMMGGYMSKVNQSTWTSTAPNGSQIIFFPEGFQQDPDLERWKGLEVNGFDLEECSELNEKSANKAIERAGSWIIPPSQYDPHPIQPPPLVLFTFNPTPNWPYTWFYLPYSTGTLKKPYKFIPATALDNPFVPEAVWRAWQNLPKAEYDRFVVGEWNSMDDPDQLIRYEWIDKCRNVEPEYGERRGGVDVAREGNDDSTICVVDGNALLEMSVFEPSRVTALGREVIRKGIEYGMDGEAWQIDAVGNGGGTVDTCWDEHYMVKQFIAGGKTIWRPNSAFKFKNRRTQAWWETREALRLGQRSLPQDLSPSFVADLTAVKYKITGEKEVIIWPKDKIKKVLGRSTDEGDAYVMATFDDTMADVLHAQTTSTISYE